MRLGDDKRALELELLEMSDEAAASQLEVIADGVIAQCGPKDFDAVMAAVIWKDMVRRLRQAIQPPALGDTSLEAQVTLWRARAEERAKQRDESERGRQAAERSLVEVRGVLNRVPRIEWLEGPRVPEAVELERLKEDSAPMYDEALVLFELHQLAIGGEGGGRDLAWCLATAERRARAKRAAKAKGEGGE